MPESGSECLDDLHQYHPDRSSAVSTTTTTSTLPTTPAASPTPGLAGERSTKEGVDPWSRSRGQSLVGGRSAVLGEGDDGLDNRLGDPTSESASSRALALPSEGSRAGPLLSRRSLRLGGEEGRGECRRP